MEKPPSQRPCPPPLPLFSALGREELRDLLEAVVLWHPEVASELEAHCRRRLVANLGGAAPLLTMLPARERALLIEQFEARTFEKGEKVMTEGEEASGLPLIAAGEVVVVAREGEERVVLATLGG